MEPCCQQPENRVATGSRAIPGGVAIVEQCIVCRRRHYTVEAEPVTLGLTLEPERETPSI